MSTATKLWAVLEDGPAAGTVFEIEPGQRVVFLDAVGNERSSYELVGCAAKATILRYRHVT